MGKRDSWGHLAVEPREGYFLLFGRVHDRRVRERFGFKEKVRRRFSSEREAEEKRAAVVAFGDSIRSRRRAVETWLDEERVRLAEWAFTEAGDSDLREVVRAGLAAMSPDSRKTLSEWLLEARKEMDGNGRREKTEKSFAESVTKFFRDTGAVRVSDFTKERLRVYLDGLKKNRAPLTVRNVRARLHRFGEFLVEREAIRENPVAGLSVPEIGWKAPEVAEPGEVEALLRAAIDYEPAGDRRGVALGYLCFGFFAGLRPEAEIPFLEKGNVFVKERELHVLRSKVTRKSQRVVTLEPVLIEWIRYLRKHRLPFFAFSRGYREGICKAAGVKWRQDFMRHSFATYWLPVHEWDVGRLAGQMGNTEPVARRDYWNLARGNQEKAGRFWRLAPEVILGAD
ncbi:MAG: site-specific integrase [Verrucomicrobiota bacterium]